MNTKMPNPHCISKLIAILLEDEEYWYAWQANIAMAFKDEYSRNSKKYKNKKDIHEIANNASENFLKLLCGIKH